LETTARYARVATGLISSVESPLDQLSKRKRAKPWRFSDADRQRVWRARHLGVRETLYGADFVKGVPCGAYRYFSMSVSLFDLDNPFPRPDPYAMRWPARAEAVKDGA
jgi:hypothetical protein